MDETEQTAMQADEADLEAQAAAAEDAQTAAGAPDLAATIASDLEQVKQDVAQLVTDAIVPTPAQVWYARIRSDNSLPDPCEFFQSGTVLTRATWTEINPSDLGQAQNNPFIDLQAG